MTEVYSNSVATLLNGAINNSVTSLTVNDASTFPTSGNFRIIIDSEIMLVTGVSGNVLTVTRGQESTSAASHSNGASVSSIITKGSLEKFRSEIFQAGNYSGRPSSPNKGQLYLIDDGPTLNQSPSNGNWKSYGPIFRFKPIVTSGFAWINQGGATEDSSDGVLILSVPTNSGDSLRIRKKTAPTPPYKVITFFAPTFKSQNFYNIGLCLRQSSDGKVIFFGYYRNNGSLIGVVRFNSPTSFNSTTITRTTNDLGGCCIKGFWLRIEDDNTNRKFQLSVDGINWTDLLSEGRTTFMTADEIGYLGNSNNTSIGVDGTFYHWDVQ